MLRGSQDSKAPGGQWDQEDMRVHLGRKVEEEQKEHKAQQDPEGSVARPVFLDSLAMTAHQATLAQVVNLEYPEWMAVMVLLVNRDLLANLALMACTGSWGYLDLKV